MTFSAFGPFGLGTTDHCAPSQCMIRVASSTTRPSPWPPPPPPVDPAAHTSSGAIAATASSEPDPSCPLGLGTTDQAVPSKCSVRVVPSCEPTAQTSFDATASAAASSLPCVLGGETSNSFHF